ncbi:FadR/GntR family transcriptional regulator [Nocardia stercoris]|uniref:FadR/GntR family transcriptional regulator n=1 Tax=Nocardia stercoris TaxID=2483361 RepID=UPI001319E643|nr:FCD domain-containing protein [Nocardia stercoris]
MEFEAEVRRAVSDAVFSRVVSAILAGQLSPGTPLPSAVDMAATFQVDPELMQDAIDRLLEIGLASFAADGSIAVVEWRNVVGIELLAEVAASGARPPRRLLTDVFVMRRAVAADAARLCAEHASDAELAEIVSAAQRYPEVPFDVDHASAVDSAFWLRVLDCCGNVGYRLLLNSLLRTFAAVGRDRIIEIAMYEEYLQPAAHRELAAAMADRRGDDAHRMAYEMLSGTVRKLRPFVN